jgi:hypothetical protein
MQGNKLRRQIAWQAAQLMYTREESEYFRAKLKAARRTVRGWVKPRDLPSNAEVREEILQLARLHEGDTQRENLRDMRLAALGLMRKMPLFRPRLIGSVLTGHVRQGSDIDLHLFADSIEPVESILRDEALDYEVQRKLVRKHGEATTYTHIHVHDHYPFELTVYPTQKANYGFKCSITGKAMERLSIAELEQFLAREYAELCVEDELEERENQPDRFQVFYSLLLPLENVKQHPKYHPEGDVLYHSLQVFDHACDRLPYDEEFLLAALLHDVGKGIDPYDHVGSGLEAVDGLITDRTAWLIEHHMVAHTVHDKSVGSRMRRRLMANENFDDLMLLNECDIAGRQVGVQTPELDEALATIRELARQFG